MADDAVWNDYIKKNISTASYGDKVWPLFEDLQTICETADNNGHPPFTSHSFESGENDAMIEGGGGMDTEPKAGLTRSRGCWNASHDRAFLDLMVEQMRNGAREGSGFRREAWLNMGKCFNMKFNLDYDVNHLKNRFRYYRTQYMTVKTLVDQNGFSWDSATRTVMADDAVWNKYIAEHPTAEIYRGKAWPLYEDLQIIFGSITIGGRLKIEDRQVNSRVGEPPTLCTTFKDPICSPDSKHFELSQPARKQPKLLMSLRRVNRRQSKVDGLQAALNRIAEASRFRASMRAESMREKWPIERCVAELKAIEGLEVELFVKALFAFRDEYNRRVFLSIDGTLRVTWLRAVCRDVFL
ncbi:hypothetical protein QJS10_CPB15g00192 [Acorus calamus]|uniref:Myb/SANT-like domain-containing protein n=1 Tax=Acorus calamus TaxID=4465 RepID=A0AAV9D6D5_ACOCL|nr:hypothetical protein QJS10_CPB15g00192 [Acorus calamus]